jgi:hypothetical protein
VLLASCKPPAHAAGTVTTVHQGAPCSTEGALLGMDSRPLDLHDPTLDLGVLQRVFRCTPVRREHHGTIRVAGTGVPVAAANVIVESWQIPPPIGGLHKQRKLLQSVSTRSEPNGSWNVAAAFAWMEGFLAADGLPMTIESLCVRAPGFVTFVFDPWRSDSHTPPQLVDLLATSSKDPIPNGSRVSSCGISLDPTLD